jgi:hypothetical protein
LEGFLLLELLIWGIVAIVVIILLLVRVTSSKVTRLSKLLIHLVLIQIVISIIVAIHPIIIHGSSSANTVIRGLEVMIGLLVIVILLIRVES